AMLGGCAWLFNKPPVAVISANPTSGEAPLEVTFDASESYDPDGDEISYEWDFGDGKGAEGETVQHGFGSPGSYTVRLLVTDSKEKSGTSSKSISVSQPPDESTDEQTFDAQSGTEYDTGTGLKVFIPPAPTEGETKLVVTENPTPQQPEGGFIELQSVYDVSLISEGGSQGQGITPKSGSNDNSSVRLTFEIPPNVDPGNVMVLHWTQEGWRLAPSGEISTATPTFGGVLHPDRRSISIEMPRSCLTSTSINPQGLGSWWESTRIALCNFKDNIVDNLDCSPIYPDIRVEGFENERKVFLHSPDRGFGGIWFKVKVIGSENLVQAPQWEPPRPYELERAWGALIDWVTANKGWYLPPTDNEIGMLTLQFPRQGGEVSISLDAGGALTLQIFGWVAKLVPFAELGKTCIEMVWGIIDNAVRSVRPTTSTRWSDVFIKIKELVFEIVKGATEAESSHLAKHLGKDVWKEILKPAALSMLVANMVTYNWTIASPQAGYCEHGYCLWDIAFTPKNQQPVASAGSAQEVTVGTLVTLDGSESSDADGDSLTYRWDQVDGPEGVNLVADTDDPRATFTPTEPGTCKFELVVNDGKADSAPAYVTITVAEKPDLKVAAVSLSKPSAQVGDTISVSFTVENKGGPLSREFQNRVFLSTTQYGGGGQKIPLEDFPMSLGESHSKSQTVEVTIPQVPDGNWYIAVFADCTEAIEESEEGNNIDSAPLSISKKTKILDRVSIDGPSQVDENSTGDYTCTAHFSDGSDTDVTNQASWSENTSYTTISSGRLNVGSLSSDKTCTVTASYTYKGVTKSASKSVTLKNVPA
ncbi:PKD domain-containing protein, partial [Candidatus Bipolaricaulota bacterium]|nr:PKD domain-containing protein [Candidatus Bipolaricaulota bacterium]